MLIMNIKIYGGRIMSNLKKGYVYSISFLLVVIVYSIKRSFSVVADILQMTLQINRTQLMLIPSIFSFSPVVGAVLGPLVDRNPIKWLFVGGAGLAIGFVGWSFSIYDYHMFLFFAFLTAVSAVVTYYSTSCFAIRPIGYGKTYDYIPEGMSRSLAPIIFAVPAFLSMLRFNVCWIFIGLAIASFVFVWLFYFSVRRLVYKPNPKASIIIHKWWKERDYWANIFTGIAFEGSAVMLGSNFTKIFKVYGLNPQNALIYFLCLFCGFNAFGRILWSWFGYQISTRLGISFGIAFIAIGLFLMSIGSFMATCIGLALIGFGGGTGVGNGRCYLGDRYGQEQIMSRVGPIQTIANPLSAGMVLLSGVAYDLFKNFNAYFIVYSLMAIGISLFFISEKNISWANKLNSKKGVCC